MFYVRQLLLIKSTNFFFFPSALDVIVGNSEVARSQDGVLLCYKSGVDLEVDRKST